MLDIGWSEFLVIGVVALVVVGPKDLPVMFRTLGRFTAKARNMSREFTRAMEAAAKESGVGDIAKDLRAVASPRSLGLDAMQNAATRFEKWDPLKKAAVAKPVAVPAPAVPAGAEPPVVAGAVGPETAALAAKRAEQRVGVIKAAEDRAEARTAAATASLSATKPAVNPQAPSKAADKPTAKAAARPKTTAIAAAVPPERVPEPAVPAKAVKPGSLVRPKAAKATVPVPAVAPQTPAKPIRRPRSKAGEA